MAHSNVRSLSGDDIFFNSWNKGYVVQSAMWNNSEICVIDVGDFQSKYLLDLAWVDCNSLIGDDMSKKGNFLQPESTLAEFGIELMVTKSLQNNSEMLRMLFFTLGIEQDVINEDHDKLVQLRHEYGVHQVHEMCKSIGKSK
jgi:hypothetical protein